MPESRAMF